MVVLKTKDGFLDLNFGGVRVVSNFEKLSTKWTMSEVRKGPHTVYSFINCNYDGRKTNIPPPQALAAIDFTYRTTNAVVNQVTENSLWFVQDDKKIKNYDSGYFIDGSKLSSKGSPVEIIDVPRPDNKFGYC